MKVGVNIKTGIATLYIEKLTRKELKSWGTYNKLSEGG